MSFPRTYVNALDISLLNKTFRWAKVIITKERKWDIYVSKTEARLQFGEIIIELSNKVLERPYIYRKISDFKRVDIHIVTDQFAYVHFLKNSEPYWNISISLSEIQLNLGDLTIIITDLPF